jgi:hypothetical protein
MDFSGSEAIMTEKQFSSEQHIIFLTFFTVYLSAAVYIKIHIGYLPEELIIRTQQFLDIIAGNQNAKQSIIGSVLLPPLPAILRTPFALLPLEINTLFMGSVISALFGAGSVLFLNTLMKNYNWNRLTRVFFLALFGLHPLFAFTSTSGSDTATFIFFFTGSLVYMLLYLKEEQMRPLLFMTLFLSLMLITTVEGLLYALFIVLVFVAVTLFRKHPPSFKEGTLLLALLPPVYTVFVWALFNWLILGDFFYFLRGISFYLQGFSFSQISFIPLLFLLLVEILSFQSSGYTPSKTVKVSSVLILLALAYIFVSPVHTIGGEIRRTKNRVMDEIKLIRQIERFPEDARFIITGYRGYILKHYADSSDNLLHIFDFYADNIYPADKPSFLLLYEPTPGSILDGIYYRYGDIYNTGADFLLLEKELPGWKIYRFIF